MSLNESASTHPMSKILESGFESVVLTLLAEMGFTCHGGDAFDLDASGERESYHGAMLPKQPRGEGQLEKIDSLLCTQ